METEAAVLAKFPGLLEGIHPSFLPLIDRSLLVAVLQKLIELGDTGTRLMPAAAKIFESLRYTDLAGVAGAVLAQDPYPEGATGLCLMKWPKDELLPKSYKPIAACLTQSQGGAPPLMPARENQHADLRPWAAQGILLLNSALTTRASRRGAHLTIWKPFMASFWEGLCRKLQEMGKQIFLIAWGEPARQSVEALAKRFGHILLTWTHPSPLVDNRLAAEKRFINCTNFADANTHVQSQNSLSNQKHAAKNGQGGIVWDNMAPVFAFTDGACAGNGSAAARAGFGVALAGGHLGRSQVCGSVAGAAYALLDPADPARGFGVAPGAETKIAPTNNRAELLALAWAFLVLLRGCAVGTVTVVSDSNISVCTINEWLPKRRQKGTGHKMENYDLLVVVEALHARLCRQADVRVEWVAAAHDRPMPAAAGRDRFLWRGNASADALAGQGQALAATAIASPLWVVRGLV